jgi:haloalkane dehalogenase
MFQRAVPGAAGQPHARISGAGHFIQEDRGAEVAEHVIHFIRATPPGGLSA